MSCVPLPQYRQPQLPYQQVDRRIVDDRFVSLPFAYRPPQGVPAKAYAAVVAMLLS